MSCNFDTMPNVSKRLSQAPGREVYPYNLCTASAACQAAKLIVAGSYNCSCTLAFETAHAAENCNMSLRSMGAAGAFAGVLLVLLLSRLPAAEK